MWTGVCVIKRPLIKQQNFRTEKTYRQIFLRDRLDLFAGAHPYLE